MRALICTQAESVIVLNNPHRMLVLGYQSAQISRRHLC